ncbi:Benzoyl-CoA reductase/2-hydroxyglutaryl-CoA dehydratase subunit, BcrC/BadD/HgdB [Desulfosporosinus orientis DSM 765]|uniref:Benzoyl-CoA reductase/2-hydroxyglutaryl-CoA dehydratase subunit, BcrC/BadD/HgdB n=1 Tax=Desulfosporosinus orientis (strain ATCC 19365 / DSM 765 / NCIMB 8382 / VKM B-1628 / Singapore I) TaxID=768706 RepID=G7W6H4_DESOD|nr:2-hydroxyacyl-CoA dehydratase family protein [Desulfosporosinus orientis]AET68612.1 Benzoyl-CoA reductase/2-hydroxyglutaryl-CoA dehydratase subunit, BcrC/BadD/HgdB [Desulfosporosinus orientis DSM 765]
MSRIEAIISELSSIANNPRKAMEDYKKETGKGSVGIMPYYAPEEIVHAAGYLPVGIWGGQKSISKARAYLPPFACSIMQSVVEMQLEGVYNDLAAVLFPVPCDTLKCLSQKWKGTSPVIVMTHPQNRKLEAANKFLAEEYRLVREKLEKILNVQITDEALNHSIDVYNENRKAMREFTDIAANYLNIIDPRKRHEIIKARFFMEKSKHTALVKELNSELKSLPVEDFTGKKVILTGIMAEPNEVLDILKENDFAVVADDLAQESRLFRIDVPAGPDPLYRLAKWWQEFDGCSLAVDTKKLRGPMLMNMVNVDKADAVVVCMMKFCDPEEFDYPIYYRQFEEAGIKSLFIEIDLEPTSFEQTKTRVQSFREML